MAGNAPVRKDDLANKLLFNMLTGPPVAPNAPKWLGFGISTPSTRHKTPLGELPRMIMSLRESLLEVTPAKPATIRAGSFREPA